MSKVFDMEYGLFVLYCEHWPYAWIGEYLIFNIYGLLLQLTLFLYVYTITRKFESLENKVILIEMKCSKPWI